MFTISCSNCGNTLKNKDHKTSIACPSCQTNNNVEAIEYYLPKILVIQGADKGKEFTLTHGSYIGRGNQNAVKLMEPKASRKHAIIEFANEKFNIRDLNSGNGTFVNGNPTKVSSLNDKDLIKIGDATLMFRNTYDYFPQGKELEGNQFSEQEINQGNTLMDIKVTSPIAESPKAILGKASAFEHTRAELSFNPQNSFIMPQTDSVADVQKTNEKLRIIYQVSNAIGSVLELQELLTVILDTVFRHIMPAQRGAILLYNEKDDPPLKTAVTKIRKKEEQKSTIHISNTLMDRVVKNRASILTMDTLLDENLKTAASVMGQIRSAMSVPLISKDKLLGVLHIDTSEKSSSFNEDTLELLSGIAGQAAIAIENAKLIKEIESEVETRGHLQRYLSPDLVEQVVNKQIDLDMGGKVQKATILFTDLRGFTKMTENIGAEAVVSILNDYFTRMVDIIFACQGTLDKFMGDAIMAIWGLPISHPEDSAFTVKAAIEMQNELFYFNISQKKTGKNTLKMGAGINTGEVVVGNMGSPKRMEYTVIGPDVNLASRVEHLTSRNHVLISDSTYMETKDIIKCTELEATKVKGIDRLIQIYGVAGIEVEGVLTKFIPILLASPHEEQENPDQQIEGLIDLFTPGNFILHFEPFADIKENMMLEFFIDLPKIVSEETLKVEVVSFSIEKHNDRDEYLEVEAKIINVPQNVRNFFMNVFGIDI